MAPSSSASALDASVLDASVLDPVWAEPDESVLDALEGSQPVARERVSAQDTVAHLQARIRSMQVVTLQTRSIPTHPAIARLLPGGALQQGATYSVERSAMLLMTLLAPPSAAGNWCAVVGMPEFGIEAARHFGIDLDRLVLVPYPGDQWLAVTAALADVVGVVAARPQRRTSDSSVSRLAARLRQRGTTMLVLGSWPQSEAMLSLSDSSWHGIGQGHGHLVSRQVTVTVTHRLTGRPRSSRLWLPDSDASVHAVENPARQRVELATAELATAEPRYGT